MPVYGSACEVEPIQLSRDLPPEKRIELYEFNFENDENEIPAKKFKKRKPREKKKGTKFFENIGKNILPTKPKKVPKKCVEKVTKRVLPKRGALRQILPVDNVQSVSSLSTKSTGQSVSHSNLKKPVCPLSSSTSNFESLGVSKNSDKSTTSNLSTRALKRPSHNSLLGESDFSNNFNQEVAEPSSPQGTLFHHISCNDFNNSAAESVVSDKSSVKQSPAVSFFKIPASVTVRNVRTRLKKNNPPRCSSPKPKVIRCSSPKSTKHTRCSSPNISRSPDRTLLFGATSPITRQSLPSNSLSSAGNENTSFNDLIYSNVKSFGNESCLITGNHDDTYKSAGEEDLCHYFGFEEEDEEELCSNLGQNVPRKTNRKKGKVKAAQPKEPEKPPVDEVLSLLKSSVPADSNLPACDPEPFSLSPHIWSPLRTQVCSESKEEEEKSNVNKRGRPRTKQAREKPALNISDDGAELKAQGQTSSKESKRCLERKQATDKDEDISISGENKLGQNTRCRTKPKMTECKKPDKFDESSKEEGIKMNNVYKAPKRGKETNKQVKDKKEAEGNKKEIDEFEALAATLNAQFEEIEHFSLAVE